MALKGNQGTLHSDVSLFMDDPLRDPDGPSHTTVDADHGRVETRVATVSADVDWLNATHRWPGLKAVGKIVRTVVEKGETRTETAYHLISVAMSPERYAKCVRLHWGVENSLHWVLDMNMDEDAARSRLDNAPANMSILRRMAVNLLSKMKDKKPISGRMRKCVLSEKYLASVLVAI
jgi:predicted transposase YbfD/YdcC